MMLSLKVYEEKRKDLTSKIDEYSVLANEAAMLNNWMEYSQLNKIILELRHELANLYGRTMYE